jgi:hypothetical protein
LALLSELWVPRAPGANPAAAMGQSGFGVRLSFAERAIQRVKVYQYK